MICRYAEEIGLPPHACGVCVYDPDEIKARRNQRIADLEAERDALKAELNELAHMVDYLKHVLAQCRYDYANNSFAASTRLAIDEAIK